MNITSILLKKVILEADSDVWSRLRKNYLSTEFIAVYNSINKYFEDHGVLPSFEILKLSTRSSKQLDKILAIEATELVEVDNHTLLEFLKNEYTQEEIMEQIYKYLNESIMVDSASESLDKLRAIITHIEDKVELTDPNEDMSRIELFHSEEELTNAVRLGLNDEYDDLMQFLPGDFILIGGRRGSGKSLTCANIAVKQWFNGRSSLYFTIEMSSRAILQRMCSIATGVSAGNLRKRSLSYGEWVSVAKWWSSRFDGGEEAFNSYTSHKSFDRLHTELTQRHKLLADKQLDISYDPYLTLNKLRSELDKKVAKLDPAIIIIDYVNQIKRDGRPNGQYEWTEQIEISKALKALAQEYKKPIVSPFQIDATGEARFAKGLLDSVDAAFNLEAYSKEDSCITFNCVKMRDMGELGFTSTMDWNSLKIGPTSATPPTARKKANKTDENSVDL